MTPDQLPGSVISHAVRATGRQLRVTKTDHHLVLTVPAPKQGEWDYLENAPLGLPIALIAAPDPLADAHLVWRPEQEGVRAISPRGSTGSRVGGSFPILTADESVGFHIVEDGFALFLPQADVSRVLKALMGTPLELPLPGEVAGLRVRQRPDLYYAPAPVDQAEPPKTPDCAPGAIQLLIDERPAGVFWSLALAVVLLARRRFARSY